MAAVRLIAGRRGDRHMNAQSRAAQQQRVRHVVAVADIGKLQPAQPPEMFLQREHVGQRLAGMIEIAQRVDHRKARPARQFVYRLLAKVRATMASVQRARLRATSLSGSRSPIMPICVTQSPPSCLMASSNVMRVRSEGFSNSRADVAALQRGGETLARLFYLLGKVQDGRQLLDRQIEVMPKVETRAWEAG